MKNMHYLQSIGFAIVDLRTNNISHNFLNHDNLCFFNLYTTLYSVLYTGLPCKADLPIKLVDLPGTILLKKKSWINK